MKHRIEFAGGLPHGSSNRALTTNGTPARPIAELVREVERTNRQLNRGLRFPWDVNAPATLEDPLLAAMVSANRS